MMEKVFIWALALFILPVAFAAGCLVVYVVARWLHGRFGWFDDLFL